MNQFGVAAVQTAPVFLDLEATVDKTCSLIKEAAKNGASLVAFPEAFIPAYPYWAWMDSPLEGSKHFEALYRNSMTVPGPWTDVLCNAAKEHQIIVVVGVNEIDSVLTGTIYNTNLIIDNHGNLLGRHRKLVPTHAEKLIWGNGDGSSLRVHQTDCGRIGTLLCGENTNTLARFALLAQGEQIHVANFPAFPFTNWYEESEAIRIRCQAHAFEGKIFVIASTSLMDERSFELLCQSPHKRSLMQGRNYALTAVFGPDGRCTAGPLVDEEGIVYADIDLDDLIMPKMMHDITGHYNQFGVLSLNLNRNPHKPLIEQGERPLHNADENHVSDEPGAATATDPGMSG
jgi:nitrilase